LFLTTESIPKSSVLGTFVYLQKAPISFAIYICMSACITAASN